jgi:lipopolysaccharide assembly outer membrane protein LptD (OstA)
MRSVTDNGTGVPVVIEQAESVNYSRERATIKATGNVQIRYGQRKLRADTFFYDQTEETIRAYGSVKIESPERGVSTARKFTLHLPTNRTHLSGLKGKYGPWIVSSPTVDGDADTELKLSSGEFTTCNLRTPHYSLKASQIYIYPGDSLVAWNTTTNLAGVPVFYFPYVNISLDDRLQRWEIKPGYGSESGMELEVNYHYLLPSDSGPYTSTIYTDMREREGAGGGFDIGYSQPGQELYLYSFLAERRPTRITESGNEVQADTEKTLWRVQSRANYQIPESNWKFHSDVNWLENGRFNDEFQSSFSGRGVNERQFNGSLVYSGERSIFRMDVIREDQVVQRNGDAEFELQREVLPRVQYQLFSLPLNLFGQRLFYSTNSLIEQTRRDPEQKQRLDGSVSQTLTKSVSMTRRWGQTYRIGYEHELLETSGEPGNYRSLGIGSFGLTNSYRPNRISSFDLDYDLARQLNRVEQVPLELGGRR